ncbi:hypothetical protein SOV_32970 [Sporomusa ovata DSM 2662]|uniref:Uncharacterized protein n=1 Tax=Sporomusa ovata TaxID=2378 RepID=A0A0U1L2Q4_9FIRM|nr:hypothetical protein [Sporomusa ovata]EQB25233.1 hypothetical protein SOV_5c04010 [Sporomusa ovata DSM 2662]CQR73795.1 hypothetical protein SpAn4DRAFT_0257 [Sporomusa ovata]
MANESAQTQTSILIAAVMLPHHKVPGSGQTLVIEAKDEEEQKKLTTEIAKAIKGDVTRLSNGIYLILRG